MIRRKKNRAVALVVVLSVVVILTLIVVSLTVAMRMERQAAFYFSERSRADFMAREGVEMAKIILSDNLGDPNNYVVTMPGKFMVTNRISGGGWTSVSLASGPVPTTPVTGVLAPPDLNKTNKTGDSLRQIDPVGGPMVLPWIYVYQDGSRSDVPSTSTNNPTIGRYAFWVDDESTRVNVNTAWKPTVDTSSPVNTNGFSHPSQVALNVLSPDISSLVATEIFNQTKIRPLQTLAEAERISLGLSAVLSTNRFSVSTYNHSPSLNPWGEPKIILTTQLSKLPPGFTNIPNYTNYFFDILKVPNADPGAGTITNTIDMDKLSARLKTLTAYLSRTDWPYRPGKSFAGKFKAAQPERITQLALDIIEYVRCTETTNAIPPVMRVKPQGSDYVGGSTETNAYLSTGRHPLLTEISLWVSDTPDTNGMFSGRVRAELYLPRDYGISSFKIAGNKIGFQMSGGTTILPGSITNNGSGTVYDEVIASSEVTGDPMTPGSYAVVTTPVFPLVQESTGRRLGTNSMTIRTYFGSSLGIWEQGNGTGSGVIYPLPAVPRPTFDDPLVQVKSMEVDDPRINKTRNDWRLNTTGNTFGAQNSIWKSSPQVSPQQDKDSDGLTFSDHSLTMPPPKGQPGNRWGAVTSVAELGRVSTGIESTTNVGVGWRTVRLQPTEKTDGELPDWALLDLFDVPLSSPNAEVYAPIVNSRAGRVNLNSSVAPFDTNGTNAKSQSLKGVVAALTSGDTSTNLKAIMFHTLASKGREFGDTNFYKSTGELSEIEGLADGGEVTETNLFSLVGLATVRSGVFRVFAIGQSIKVTPKGDLIINSTKSVETTIEATDETAKRFRSVTWRENQL